MAEQSTQRRSVGFVFVSRFDDLLSPLAYAVFALGLLFTWIWMGFIEGHPVFTDGVVDCPAVVGMLLAFAASLLAQGFVPRLDNLAARPAAWVGAAGVVCVACAAMVAVERAGGALGATASLALVRGLAFAVGLSSAVLLRACLAAFACLRPSSAAIGFFSASAVAFASYFCLDVFQDLGTPQVKVALFCLLPLFAAGALALARVPVTERLKARSDDTDVFAKGYRQMSLSFVVFSFAMGAKAAMEPAFEMGTGSSLSVAAFMGLSLLLGHLIVTKVGVFRLIKVAYVASVLVLTVCVTLARLGEYLDPYLSVVFNIACTMLFMVLWLLVAFVASTNEAKTGKVVAVAFACAAAGMALGWVAGSVFFAHFGHDRIYFSIAISCATAVFSTVGFSAKSFPYLTVSGEGAKRMQRNRQAESPTEADYNRMFADSVGLSTREYEVFELLMVGHNATSAAVELQVSYHTARSHVRNIYKKLDVHSHAELLGAVKAFRCAREAQQDGRKQ